MKAGSIWFLIIAAF